eukprot:IDg5652t1
MEDSNIVEGCALKRMINEGRWLSGDFPSLLIGPVSVRPYLMGDCASILSKNIMKSSSEAEQRANPFLKSCDSYASDTRKPIKWAF